MNENGEILKSLGELTGLVKASNTNISSLSTKYDKLVETTQNIATAVTVMQTGYSAKEVSCAKEFKDINDKLGRDYIVLNNLKEKALVANGVEAYKGKKRDWWQWALGIVGAFVGILISINQLVSIGQKVKLSDNNITSSVYATPLDTLKDTTNFTMEIDTIRGN